MNEPEAAKKIKEWYPEMKILVLTMHKGVEYLRKSRPFGLDGFVLKEDVDLLLLYRAGIFPFFHQTYLKKLKRGFVAG